MTNCTIVPKEQTQNPALVQQPGFSGILKAGEGIQREDEATDEDSWNWARLCNQEQFIGTGKRLR